MLVFNSEKLARKAKDLYNGQLLDKKEIVFEMVGPVREKESRSSGIASRLGAKKGDVFSRLAPKIEDRLGPRLEDRLGKATKQKPQRDTSAPKHNRSVKSYGDITVSRRDGDF